MGLESSEKQSVFTAAPPAGDLGAITDSFPTLDFQRIIPDQHTTIRTGLTTEHLRLIADWENGIWTAEAKPYGETVEQFSQEIIEAREIWTSVLEGQADLGESRTLHHLREEIGDGIIAGIGILRSVLDRDDQKIQAALTTSLNQAETTKQTTTESRISLYVLKGQRLVEKLRASGGDMNVLTSVEKNDIVLSVGGVMKAGVEALDKLGIGVGEIIEGKIAKNHLKYSPQRIAATGSSVAAKQDWDARQLPVIQEEGEVILLKAA